MKGGLESRLKGLSSAELTDLADCATRESLRLRMEAVTDSINTRVDQVLESSGLDGLQAFDSYITNYPGLKRRVPVNDLYLPESEYDAKREEIKKLILNYYDTHPKAEHNKINIYGFFEVIPKLIGIVKSNRDINPNVALAQYLKAIRKEKGSRIKFDGASKTYSILSALSPSEMVDDVLGNKRRIEFETLQKGTGLNGRQINVIMVTNRGWNYTGKLPDRTYFR